jgi:Tol biopolymer transport system component
VVKGEFQRAARRSDDDYGVVVDWAVVKVPVGGGQLQRLTPWRRRQVLRPFSFSPDGTTLTAERESRAGVDAVAVELDSGRIRLLARDAEEPIYSPDGSQVAFVRTIRSAPGDPGLNPRPTNSTLFLMPAAGGPATELVRVKGGLAWPSWDPSGQRIAFTRLGGGTFGLGSHPQEGNTVMQVNVDGSCLTTLLETARGSLYGSAWQPGIGREAGPIIC